MGRLLARIFTRQNYHVIILGRNRTKLRKIAARIHAQTGDLADLPKARIVIVSVPIESMVDVCADALQHMAKDSLLIDIASVKTGVVDKIERHVPTRIQYLSLHPLFGPSTRSTKGRNIVAVRVRPGPLCDRMISLLRNLKFNIRIVSAEEHDKAMAVFQVMHHYAFLVLGVKLAEIMRRNQEVWNLVPRSMKRTLEQLQSMNMIIETLLAIQRYNPYATAARRAFAVSASRMATMDDGAVLEIKKAMSVIKSRLPTGRLAPPRRAFHRRKI